MGTPFRLGTWHVRPELGRISGSGGDVHLSPKVMGVLVCLARRAPEVVTKEELFQEVWDGAFVTEGVLTYVISGLRKALGDDARNPCFIETIPTRGYRLIAPPRFEEEPVRKALPGRERGLPLLASALGLVFGVGLTTWFWMRPGEERPVPFEERDWLLVVPFEDGHRAAGFHGSLEHALEEELDGSGLFRVASRSRIEETLRLMRMPKDAELDLPVAREVALRDGAVRAVLTGRTEKREGGLLVSVRVIDPVSGAAVSSRTRFGETEEEVLLSFRGLSTWVRDVLEEELPSLRKAVLPRVTTRSLDALELYSQAMAFAEEDKWLPASDLFDRAVAEDPDFASAHVWLAHSYSNLGRGEPGPHYERAFALAADLSDRERYFILGSYYGRHLLDDEKAVQAFEILTRISPDDYWSAYKLANAYHRLGRYQEATVYRLRAADLRPGSFSENASAVLYLNAYGGGAASDTPYFQRAKRLATSETTRETPWAIAELELVPADESWIRGDLPRTLEHVEHLAQSTSSHGSAVEPYLVEYTARAYLSLGMIRAAESRFALLPDVDRRNYLMAQAALARGDEVSFGRYLSRVDIAEHIADEWMDASVLVASGRTGILSPARARLVSRALATLQQGTLPDALREMSRDFSTVSRGELALARGDLDEAIILLQQGMDRFQRRPAPIFFLTAESLADAWEKRGNPERALQVLEDAATHKQRAFSDGVFRMRVQLRIAEFNRTLRREGQAREVESELRQLLLYADSDHAILGRLERLSATKAPAPPHRLSVSHTPSGS